MQVDNSNQISKQEYEEFIKQTSNLHTDQKTKQCCLKYFLDYKKITGSIPSEKLSTTIRCAFFMSEKSQCTYNVKGQKVRGIGLSLNQFLKNYQLDDFIIILRDMLKKIKINDSETQNDLNQIVKRISFLIMFHMKFQKILQKLDLKQKNQSVGYAKIFSSFVWLLYIDAKNKILKNSLELIDNTCMLAHVIAFMVIYAWEYMKPQAFETAKKLNQRKQISVFVQQRIFEMFIIKNVDIYRLIAKSFEQYFQNLVNTNIIKMSNGKIDFLSTQNINLNYKKLDYFYQKGLNPQDLDQRIFLKQRAINLTPSRFTPLARVGYINKLANKPTVKNLNNFVDSNKQNFSSHRILTYDMISETQTPKPISCNPNQIKIPKTVINSPSLMKTNLICSTPITTSMQMYNYLNEKSKKAKQSNYAQRKYDMIMMNWIDKLLDKSNQKKSQKTKQSKLNLIYSLYKVTSEDYLVQNQYDKENQNIFKSFLALSTQLVFFVSNITMSFQDIQKFLETQMIEQWKACDYFLKFDRAMPSTLKLHLLDLEVNLISFKIWEDQNLINIVQAFANNQSNENIKLQIIQKCFKRILHQIAYQITQLSTNLRLDDKISDYVFESVKDILINHTEILFKRHIDQMIICSIYANCKANQIDIKFNEIKQKYEEINQNNKNLHDMIICKVYIQQGSSVDIIKFYNQVYMGKMKLFILNIKENNNPNTNRNISNLMQSNLKAIIPKQLSFNKLNNKQKGTKTPQTNLLYAYNQSPILKIQTNNFKGNLHSKKIINFDEQQKILKKRCIQIPEKDEGLTQANDFISKKFSKQAKNGITNTSGIQKKQSQKILVYQNRTSQQPHQRSLYQKK